MQNIHNMNNDQITLNGDRNIHVNQAWVFEDDQERWYQSFIVNLCALAMSLFRYLTFDRYYWINQDIECHMFIQYVYHLCQMKEEFLVINVRFSWRKLINCTSCSIILWWGSHGSRGFPYINYTYAVYNQYQQTSLMDGNISPGSHKNVKITTIHYPTCGIILKGTLLWSTNNTKSNYQGHIYTWNNLYWYKCKYKVGVHSKLWKIIV